jgi:hypothetical protein
MATENRVLETVTEMMGQVTRLWQAAWALAQMGQDHEIEAAQLEELLAPLRGWSEHLQEAARELGRRQRPPG